MCNTLSLGRRGTEGNLDGSLAKEVLGLEWKYVYIVRWCTRCGFGEMRLFMVQISRITKSIVTCV